MNGGVISSSDHSMAFNAKNLEYNKQEPAFLRKLKGEFGGLDGRHNVQIARPKKDRLKTGDDDDDPLIVDEQGETVEKAEYERRMNGGDEVQKLVDDGEDEGPKSEEQENAKKAERQQVTEIGTSGNPKKRKAGKVVRGEEADEIKPEEAPVRNKDDQHEESDKKASSKKVTTAAKKKGKKIKLSFDNPEG